LADFDDLTEILVTEYGIGRHICSAFTHVEIGAADVS
jgi:hypothetical protein